MGGAHLPRVPGQEYADEKPRSRAAPTVACAPSAEDERKAHIARTKLAHVAQDQLIFSAEKPGAKAPPQASALPATKHRYTTPVGFKPRYTTPVAPCAPHSHQQRKKGQRSKGRKHSNSRSGLKPSPRLPPESHPLQQQERIKRCPVGGGAQEGVEAEAVHGDKDQQDHEWAINESTVQRRRKVAKVSHDMLRDSRCGAELEALKRIFQREHFMGNSGAPSSATALAANGSQAGSTSNSAVTVSSSARSGGAVVAVAGGAAGGPAAAAGCALYALLPKLPLEQYSLLEDAAVALTRCKREVAVNVQDESFQVFAKALTGRTVTVDVKSSDTIWEVLLKTSLKDGVPAHFQRVGYRGSQLDPSRTVASCGIRKETTLHLSARVRGGMQIFYPYGKTVAYNVDPPVPYATSNAVPVPEGGKASHLYAALREDDPLLPDGFTIKWMHKDLGKWVPLKDAIDRDIPPRGADLMICAPPTDLKRLSPEDFQERVASEVKRQLLDADKDVFSEAVCKELLGNAVPAMPDGPEALWEFLKHGKLPVTLDLQQLLHIRGVTSLDESITVCPRACRLACYVSDRIICPVNAAGASEEMCADVCAVEYVIKMFTQLTAFAPAVLRRVVKMNKNTSVKATCTVTQPAKRPDLTGVAEALLTLAGEEKVDDELYLAVNDIAQKFQKGLDKLHYGSVPFIPVFAAAGSKFRWGLVWSTPGKTAEWGVEYDITCAADCVRLSLASANIYRLMSAILRDAATIGARSMFPYFTKVTRPALEGVAFRTTIEARPGVFVKTIQRADEFFEHFGNELDVLQVAYSVANGCQFMVKTTASGPTQALSKGGVEVYQVTMTRLGQQRKPLGMSEPDLRRLAVAVLQGLKALGEYSIMEGPVTRTRRVLKPKPICHKDNRFDNVLWDTSSDPAEPFLTDLELADWAGPVKHAAFTAWDDRTLEVNEHGVPFYTHCSDVYQLGKMMECYKSLNGLSEAGGAFMQLLLLHTHTSKDALAALATVWP